MSDDPDRNGTRAADELEFTRIFDAPRQLVFACMTEPAHLTHFWGPLGTRAPLERIHLDLRPGGRFETVMVDEADGVEYPTHATFVDVVVPERLVWRETLSGMTVTVTFADIDGSRTEVRIHQVNVPEPVRSPEARAGFLTSLDRFAAHLAGLGGNRAS